MASLITGYEYDIFISYRQKDNKGEKWVSEFVEALKTELESTFKEEISIYFDINPHDGLLETHDVDASLKDKLKCLVFIPVLSRTYCDTNSFAWRNEFEAFTEQASKDQFGLKVKLPNGNIANRVLPVRIHDLDLDDIKLCESIIGGVLRDIEFIYKSEGVNRPLRSKEDKPDENLNKTIYRDQVNKTALAIKEIILGLKGEPDMSVEKSPAHREQERAFYEVRKPARSPKKKLLIGTGVLAILIITALFTWPGLIGRNNLKRLIANDGRIPIAVMPFQNMTHDTTWNVWQDGVQNILISNLSNSQELKVRQPETVTSILRSKGLTDYASLTPSINGTISRKLETNVYITGSIKQSGSTIRLSAQLNNSKTKEALKSFQIDGTAENILNMTDSLSLMLNNFLIIIKLGDEIIPDFKPVASTKSPEAYKYFVYGNNALMKGDFSFAANYFSQALAIDSDLYYATIELSTTYMYQGLMDQAKKLCLNVYNKRDQMPPKLKIHANQLYAFYFETPFEQEKYLNLLLEFDDKMPTVYMQLGIVYSRLFQYDKAIPEYEKALEIYNKWDSKPLNNICYTFLGEAYHKTSQYKKEKKLYKKAERDFPDDPEIIYPQAVLSLTEGDTVEANRYIEKFISILKSLSATEAVIDVNLASIYSQAGILDKAEEYFRQALSLEPENLRRQNDLAYFLIDKDRNINEGLDLVEKILKINPDAMNASHNKGWALYKQGKYQEALEFLQKSWDLRMKNAVYDYDAFQHLEAAKKAVAGQK